MESSKELDELALKVKQTYYQDGLADMLMGGFMLLFAVFFLAISEIHASPSSSTSSLTFIPVLFPSIVLMFMFAYLIEAAKRRWVYPRAGFVKVKPLHEGTKRDQLLGLLLILTIILGPIIVLFILAGLPGMIFWLGWVAPVSFGLLLAIGPMIVARQYHLKRYYLYAILPSIIGLVVPWLTTGWPSIYAAFFFVMAIELAVVGSLAGLSGLALFLSFIRRHPIESIDIEEGDLSNASF